METGQKSDCETGCNRHLGTEEKIRKYRRRKTKRKTTKQNKRGKNMKYRSEIIGNN